VEDHVCEQPERQANRCHPRTDRSARQGREPQQRSEDPERGCPQLRVAAIMFGVLFLLVVLRVPVAFALALACLPIFYFEPRLTPVLVLQDLAAVMPPDSQLDTLALQLNRPGDPEQPLGTLNLNGRSVISHAGVEQVLLQLDKITTFGGLHLNSSTEEEIEELDDPISTFIVEGELGERAATGRYVDGLPEERS
jgi:hypothetical protein